MSCLRAATTIGASVGTPGLLTRRPTPSRRSSRHRRVDAAPRRGDRPRRSRPRRRRRRRPRLGHAVRAMPLGRNERARPRGPAQERSCHGRSVCRGRSRRALSRALRDRDADDDRAPDRHRHGEPLAEDESRERRARDRLQELQRRDADDPTAVERPVPAD